MEFYQKCMNNKVFPIDGLVEAPSRLDPELLEEYRMLSGIILYCIILHFIQNK